MLWFVLCYDNDLILIKVVIDCVLNIILTAHTLSDIK